MIGYSNLPLTHAGDTRYRVARVKDAQDPSTRVEARQSDNEPDDLDDRGEPGN